MHRKRVVLTAYWFAFAFADVSLGDLIIVDRWGGGDFRNITDAVAAANPGDTIQVWSGVYAETVAPGGKQLIIESLSGAERTIITPPAGVGDTCVIYEDGEDATSILDGFTLRDGRGRMTPGGRIGGGLVISDSSPTIRNCRIESCSADFGGGISIVRGDPIISDCHIESCSAESGGGIGIRGGNPVLTLCILEANTAGHGSGVFATLNAAPSFQGCRFRANYGGSGSTLGGAAYSSAGVTVEFESCEFVGNRADQGSALYLEDAAAVCRNCTVVAHDNPLDLGAFTATETAREPDTTIEVYNGIFWDNDTALDFATTGGAVISVFVTINNTFVGKNGNFLADPLFVDAGIDDVRLRPNSPAMDAGDDDFSTIDIDSGGCDRITDGDHDGTATVNLGAYESIGVSVSPGDSIHDAIYNNSRCASVIEVADGTYVERIGLARWPCAIVSVNGAESTIIESELGGSVVTGTRIPPDFVFSGFTITGSGHTAFKANGPTVTYCIFRDNSGDLGGAMNCGGSRDMRVIHCMFINNKATDWGGGISNTGSGVPTVDSCVFVNNSAPVGGGMFNVRNTVVTNCLFVENSADEHGGAIFTYEGTIRNCTFVRNSAPHIGGLHQAGRDFMSVANCVFWDNPGGEINVPPSYVSYSIVRGGYPGGVHILDADPLFVDPANGDFRIQSGSPAIDAGDNTALAVGVTTDLDGNPRFVDDPNTPDTGVPGGPGGSAIVDIGAYEFQGECDPCDMNCDGDVNALDIETFLELLFAGGEPCGVCTGDVNGDGNIDALDIEPFIACLFP